MNVTIFVGDKTFTATNFFDNNYMTNWNNRVGVQFTITSTYAEVVSTFVDDLEWKVLQYEERDMSSYSVAGPIIDNRDGTLTVMMGKPTDLEKMIETIYGGVN